MNSFTRHIPRSFFAAALCAAALSSCSDNSGNGSGDEPEITYPPQSPVPDLKSEIEPFDPATRATDSYSPGTDNDIYWEANRFNDTVRVVYNGNSASVTSTSSAIRTDVDDAYVTLRIPSGRKTAVIASGTSHDGGLKLYSASKVMLTLDNLTLESKEGPAINSQSKTRLFLRLADNSVNYLADPAVYAPADRHYTPGASAETEDRKGAFFAEDHVTVSGHGLLEINGNYAHAFATDGMLRILGGVTLTATSNVRNAIHAKGSSKEQRGISIDGGYVYTLCKADAAKCIKSDMPIFIGNAKVVAYNEGGALFDESDSDTSSGAGIKSDADVIIAGADIDVRTTGNGAKGIKADGNLTILDGVVTVSCTGCRFSHADGISSSPSGLKADGHLTVEGGSVKVAMFGDDTKCDAFDARGEIRIGGGESSAYAYGNGFCADTRVRIAGGKVYCFSERDEAISAAEAIEITGGTVISQSPTAMASSADGVLTISNATVVAAGGRSMVTPAGSRPSDATIATVGSLSLQAGEPIALVAGEEVAASPLFAMTFRSPLRKAPLLLATDKASSGSPLTLLIGGSIAGGSTPWEGLVEGGSLPSPTSSLQLR